MTNTALKIVDSPEPIGQVVDRALRLKQQSEALGAELDKALGDIRDYASGQSGKVTVDGEEGKATVIPTSRKRAYSSKDYSKLVAESPMVGQVCEGDEQVEVANIQALLAMCKAVNLDISALLKVKRVYQVDDAKLAGLPEAERKKLKSVLYYKASVTLSKA
jgi:hypothetical protein